MDIARALKWPGAGASARKDYMEAYALLQEALRTQVEAREYNAEMVDTLEWLASTLLAPEFAGKESNRARLQRATSILGAVEARREEMGAPIPPVNRPRHEQTVRTARSHTQGAFDSTWKEGRALTFEQVAMLALQDFGRPERIQALDFKYEGADHKSEIRSPGALWATRNGSH